VWLDVSQINVDDGRFQETRPLVHSRAHEVWSAALGSSRAILQALRDSDPTQGASGAGGFHYSAAPLLPCMV
jgi:hypothetical protein